PADRIFPKPNKNVGRRIFGRRSDDRRRSLRCSGPQTRGVQNLLVLLFAASLKGEQLSPFQVFEMKFSMPRRAPPAPYPPRARTHDMMPLRCRKEPCLERRTRTSSDEKGATLRIKKRISDQNDQPSEKQEAHGMKKPDPPDTPAVIDHR